MFALTRKTDYAIIALSFLARRPGRLCNAREIAERFHLPHALLVKVLKTLNQGELVRSIRGAKGGYTLAIPADRITLASIISTIEGPIRFVQCATQPEPGERPCELANVCPVTRSIRKIHDKLTQFMDQVTLAEIAGDAEVADAPVCLSVEGHEMKLESTI